MTRIIFILTFGLLISSCNNRSSNNSNSIPEIMKPNWREINIEKFPVKFGQILKFNIKDVSLKAVVLDFKENNEGKWFGVCFIKENKLFGRQIPNGMINTTCLDLLDLTYILNNEKVNFEIVESLKINKAKIGIGSQSTAININEIKRDFKRGIEQRKHEQTLCHEKILDLNPTRECYYNIKKIKN